MVVGHRNTKEENMDYYVDVECRYYKRTDGVVDKTAPKEILKLSIDYKDARNDIRELLLDEIGKPDAEESDFCHSFKYAGFKCIKVSHVENASPKNATALGRVNLMIFDEI